MKTILIIIAISITVLMCGCNTKQPETSMEQNPEPAFPKGEKITNNNFAGTAYLYLMGASDTTLHTSFGNVTFEPKARTNWHSHPGGQILFITEGQGYYQAKGQPARLLCKGDVVEIPRNVVHWHGAAPDFEFSHIAVSLNIDDGGAVWSEPVTEEEYNKATK